MSHPGNDELVDHYSDADGEIQPEMDHFSDFEELWAVLQRQEND